MNESAIHGQRAVILGASLAGLLAARVLSERYDEVVLLERDELPDHPAPRKGTPHAVHPHGLLARGLEVLESLFPGFTQALVARGAVPGDLQGAVAFHVSAQRLADGIAGRPALCASRLSIEHEVRRRVAALPGVRIVTNVDIGMPEFDAAEGRVVAARYTTRASGDEQRLASDLTVDCTGRATHMPAWLRQWGLGAPVEEKVEIGICYVSAYFKRTGALDIGKRIDKPVVICGATNDLPRPGVLIAQEPDEAGTPRWVMAVGGYAGDHPAPTLAGMRERVAELGSSDMKRVVEEGELMGEVIRYHLPCSVRRRYERLARFPAGLLLLGDSMTHFNPIYGQGMTVAACEALALQQELARGERGLARRYFRAAARTIDIPWQMAVGGDLSIDSVPGPRPFPLRLINAYVARVQRAAMHDAAVSLAFQRVVHMLAAPPSLFAPAVLWRVWRHGGRSAAPLRQPQAQMQRASA